MPQILVPSLFDYVLSDVTKPGKSITLDEAKELFIFFKNNPLFKWQDVHNNCEARAEAICILLTVWQVPHYKGWVFSGAFLKNHIGGLKQLWNYHVGALLPVLVNEQLVNYIIDPSTSGSLQTLEDWAANVTEYPHSYHLIKSADYYIFPHGKIFKDNWHKRNKQNRKWVIQGLAGINGLSGKGKAQLCFRKNKLRVTAERFWALRNDNPLGRS